MRLWSICLLFGLGIVCPAQNAYFDAPTDAIEFSGNTSFSDCTIEAVVLSESLEAVSVEDIWIEWRFGEEHKGLAAWSGGYFFSNQDQYLRGPSLPPYSWAHLAFVSGSQVERLYIDGVLMAERGVGSRQNATGSLMLVGACPHIHPTHTSFLGAIDSLRVSTVARYGSSFGIVRGDLSNDQSTTFLLNFNEASGTSAIVDEAGSRPGQLGAGFSGATSPELGHHRTPIVSQVTALQVILGRVTAGGLAELQRLDNNSLTVCKFFVPNQLVPPIDLRFSGTVPTTADILRFRLGGRMATAGSFEAVVQLFDWGLNQFSTEARSAFSIATGFRWVAVSQASRLQDFIQSNGNVLAKVTIRQVGPASGLQWCSLFDEAAFVTE